jgi:hypothetical protein
MGGDAHGSGGGGFADMLPLILPVGVFAILAVFGKSSTAVPQGMVVQPAPTSFYAAPAVYENNAPLLQPDPAYYQNSLIPANTGSGGDQGCFYDYLGNQVCY